MLRLDTRHIIDTRSVRVVLTKLTCHLGKIRQQSFDRHCNLLIRKRVPFLYALGGSYVDRPLYRLLSRVGTLEAINDLLLMGEISPIKIYFRTNQVPYFAHQITHFTDLRC